LNRPMKQPMNTICSDVSNLQNALIQWYEKNRRDLPWRQTRDPYRIWVSEVMLQQTQVKTGIPYYLRFLQRFPDIATLAAADISEVLKLWEGLGYYARAKNLHKAAGLVMQNHHGRVPGTVEAFRALPGVGDYIAAAVQSIAFARPLAVVDGNVKRVLARVFCIDTPVNHSRAHAVFSSIAQQLIDVRQPAAFNQGLMELGALVCRPSNPLCPKCPVAAMCRALEQGRIDAFPRRITKKAVPTHHLIAGVISRNERVLITLRPLDIMLGGLWEFPGGRLNGNQDGPAACVREIRETVNLDVAVDGHLAQIRHAYSHFKIVMDVFACRHLAGRIHLRGPADFAWVFPKQLDNYPFSGAHRKLIPTLQKHFWNPAQPPPS
jgi:A/G-specific adenine glycosylase